MHISVYAILWLSINLEVYCSLEKSGVEVEVKLLPTVSQSVSQSVLVSGSHLDLMAKFFYFLSNNCGFLDVGHPLWRQDGFVIYLYNCFCALPEQSLSSQRHAELTTIFYCLIWDSPNLVAKFLYLCPQGTR
jgi:hypothetical protein